MKSSKVVRQISVPEFAKQLQRRFEEEGREIFIGTLQNQEKKQVLKELEEIGCSVEFDLKLGYKITAID